jgi:hypothetical protein
VEFLPDSTVKGDVAEAAETSAGDKIGTLDYYAQLEHDKNEMSKEAKTNLALQEEIRRKLRAEYLKPQTTEVLEKIAKLQQTMYNTMDEMTVLMRRDSKEA